MSKEETMSKLQDRRNRQVERLIVGVAITGLLSVLMVSSAYACLGQDGTAPNFISAPTEKPKGPGGEALARMGSEPVLVILVDFNNCAGTWNQDAWFQRLLMDNPGPGQSMRDYYHEASYHLTYNFPGIDFYPAHENSGTADNGVAGWYRMSFNHPYSTYGTDWEYRTGESLPGMFPGCTSWAVGRQLAYLAIKAADANVNYAYFQTYNGGPGDISLAAFELHIMIIVAGYERSYSGAPTPSTWRYHWALPGAGYYSQDGDNGTFVGGSNYAGAYGQVGEKAPNNNPLGQGLVAHEMGHDLGLPDLYDTDRYTNGYGNGVGEFCLMAGGDWLGNPAGTGPAHLSAWCKIDQGWLTPTTLWNKDSLRARIACVETCPCVYRMNPYNKPSSNQYFLIENRYRRGFELTLPGAGLLVYHVDDSMIAANRSANKVNTRVGYTDALHYGVDVECQDGYPRGYLLDHLDDADYGNRGDTGDPWFKRPNFNGTSTPNTSFYRGVPSYVAVESISQWQTVMTADLFYQLPHDVGITGIIAPKGLVKKGTSLGCSAQVRNLGTNQETFNAIMKVGAWTGNANNIVLNVGEEKRVSFGTWTASQKGTFAVTCTTQLGTDMRTSNDFKRDSVIVRSRDLGLLTLLSPAGTIDSGLTVVPACSVYNYGTETEDYGVRMKIGSFYNETATIVGHPDGSSRYVTFPAWVVSQTGSHSVSCSTELAQDSTPENDKLTGSVTVSGPGQPGWEEKAGVPGGADNKGVKDGGCLAANDESDGNHIYGLKGNNTCEFYKYSTSANTWTTKQSITQVGASGKKKTVKKGASMAQAGGTIYAAKGNNCLEFWQYDPAGDAWHQKADVTTGAKNVKEGSGSATATLGDTTYVYFLKGSNTQEFYRYNTTTNAWQSLPDAPAGLSGKAFKNGSCITYDPDHHLVYVLKGSYNEFYTFDVTNNAWATKAALPLIGSSGRKKKVKDGAGLAYHDGKVYGLKGDNTLEFWLYDPGSDKWTQLEDMPIGGGKKVKGGGALVVAGGVLYATKGNNTLEFYQFGTGDDLGELAHPAGGHEGGLQVATGRNPAARTPQFALHVAPNPFSGVATIVYSRPKAGSVRLVLYDAVGRLVSTLASGYHDAGTNSLQFTARSLQLPCGIYLLRLETEDYTAAQKLILE
jgi:M6 family metalloprotease-like protein